MLPDPAGDPRASTISALMSRAVAAFERRYRQRPTVAAAAPGRVNLIGEHTDYNDGLVLPLAIDRAVVMVGCATVAPHSTLYAIDLDESMECSLIHFAKHAPSPHWAGYVIGVAQQFVARGRQMPNLNIAFMSTVPIGAGLSSSATSAVERRLK